MITARIKVWYMPALDEKTARLMNQFKLAADVDVTRLVAFAVKHFFETYPELKTIIKQFLQNSEL